MTSDLVGVGYAGNEKEVNEIKMPTSVNDLDYDFRWQLVRIRRNKNHLLVFGYRGKSRRLCSNEFSNAALPQNRSVNFIDVARKVTFTKRVVLGSVKKEELSICLRWEILLGLADVG